MRSRTYEKPFHNMRVGGIAGAAAELLFADCSDQDGVIEST